MVEDASEFQYSSSKNDIVDRYLKKKVSQVLEAADGDAAALSMSSLKDIKMSILSKDSILGYFDRLKDAGLDEESVFIMKQAYKTSIEQNSRHAEYLRNFQGNLHHLAATSKDNLESTYQVPSHWKLV